MTALKATTMDTLPVELQRRIVSSLWRDLYRRTYGRGDVEDQWLFWAARQLRFRKQVASDEALPPVTPDMLNSLDAQTWLCFVRGRALTERNWRAGVATRSVVFLEGRMYSATGINYMRPHFTYGTVVVRPHRLGIAAAEEAWQISQDAASCDRGNVTHGTLIDLDYAQDGSTLYRTVPSNDEFVVLTKRFPAGSKYSKASMQGVDNEAIDLRGGWLLVRQGYINIDVTNPSPHTHLIFDLYRGRLAAAITLHGTSN
ncbi:hypothetical protein THASP1DRAFT_24481, partial [Thamnocephalis sphaerospora]